jgi:hypothetical protein
LILESFSKEVVVQGKSASQSVVYFSEITNEDCDMSAEDEICPLIYNDKKDLVVKDNSPI